MSVSEIQIEKDLHLLYEVGALRNTRRGWSYISELNFQNLAEHTLRCVFIALLISRRSKVKNDLSKLIRIGMIYNLYKVRTGDFHYISRVHTSVSIETATVDQLQKTSLAYLIPMISEYEKLFSNESKLIYASNALENRLELQELSKTGAELAETWAKNNDRSILPKVENDLVREYWSLVINSDPNEWHLVSKNDFGFKDDHTKLQHSYNRDINFLYEVGSLKYIDRTWDHFVGNRFQNVSEHTLRVMYITLLLCIYEGVDPEKALIMALIHDLHEIRSGDLNYLTKKYTQRDQEEAVNDTLSGISCESFLKKIWLEFSEQSSSVARIVRDADRLEPVIELKEQERLGMKLAEKWLDMNMKSLRKNLNSDSAHRLLEAINCSDPDRWHLTSVLGK